MINSAILIGSIAVNVFLTAILLLFFRKINLLESRYISFISKFDNEDNLEITLNNYVKMVNNVNEENKIISAMLREQELELKKCYKNMSIIKYDAFDDVGNNLSFVIALLDDNNNGVIINSIYGRSSSNIYVKNIENGISNKTLSDEEILALNKVKENKKI